MLITACASQSVSTQKPPNQSSFVLMTGVWKLLWASLPNAPLQKRAAQFLCNFCAHMISSQGESDLPKVTEFD